MININLDQTAQVSILTSVFGAQCAKGPVLFLAISKSGGNAFHGSLYLYSRNGTMTATDAYMKAEGVANPEDQQLYPGYTLGEPVLLLWLKFNRNRDKPFFFSGYKYDYQLPAGTVHEL